MAVDSKIITRSRCYADEVIPSRNQILLPLDCDLVLAIMRKLMRLAYEYEEVFESVVYAIEDIHSSSRFVKEIIRTGVDVL